MVDIYEGVAYGFEILFSAQQKISRNFCHAENSLQNDAMWKYQVHKHFSRLKPMK